MKKALCLQRKRIAELDLSMRQIQPDYADPSQALHAWEIERNADIVKVLVGDPVLLARVRLMPGPLARCTDLVARADAELARLAIESIL